MLQYILTLSNSLFFSLMQMKLTAVDDARRGMETLWPALALQLVYMTRALHLEMLLKVLYKDIRN